MRRNGTERRRVDHWTAQYLGLPWVAGERDCWSFFREVQRERYGRAVPAIDIDASDFKACARTMADHPERRRWVAVPWNAIRDGDGVLMGRGSHPFHVGVFVEPHYVLHCLEGAGVVLQDMMSLAAHGWHDLRYYTPCN